MKSNSETAIVGIRIGGATDSLDGEILYFGRNIPVKQGFYEVVINLSDKTYELKQKATRQSNN